jgi:hypothetical protein
VRPLTPATPCPSTSKLTPPPPTHPRRLEHAKELRLAKLRGMEACNSSTGAPPSTDTAPAPSAAPPAPPHHAPKSKSAPRPAKVVSPSDPLDFLPTPALSHPAVACGGPPPNLPKRVRKLRQKLAEGSPGAREELARQDDRPQGVGGAMTRRIQAAIRELQAALVVPPGGELTAECQNKHDGEDGDVGRCLLACCGWHG